MNLIPRPLVASLVIVALAGALSYGMDGQDPPPAPKADDKPVAKNDDAAKADAGAAAESASNEKARAILKEAAGWQNAGDLGQPGKLVGFHVVFAAAQFERQKTNDKGEPLKPDLVEADPDGLVFDWMQGSIKTQVTVDGNTTTKALYDKYKIAWISDGKSVSTLAGAGHKNDYDEILFHQRVIDQLLEVAFLDKLARDQSRWKVLDDNSHPGAVAIQRVPTGDAVEIVQITLWIEKAADGSYGKVVAAAMPPLERGGPTLYYDFTYDRDLVKVSRAQSDGKLVDFEMNFPSLVDVYEQRAGKDERRRVLHVQPKQVLINTVVDADFAQPVPAKK